MFIRAALRYGFVNEVRGEIQKLTEVLAGQITDAGEIDAMKAKLDAAGVSYRSNASKESLEKLIAEHS